MNVRQIPTLVIALLLLCATAEAKYRTWTDTQERTVTADFVRINNGNVVLKQNNGKVIQVPYLSLSDEDQEFVRELLEAKGQADQLPRKPPSGFNTSPIPNAPFAGAGMPPAGAGAAAGGASGNAMPPAGYMPGRMPPGTGPGMGNTAPGSMPGAGATAGAPYNPGSYPPGSMPPGTPGAYPGAAGSPPAGYPPATGNSSPGSNLPGATPGGAPGMSPAPGTGMPGAGMPPMASSFPGANSPSQPIGVPPVTPGMGGPGTPQIQWVETKICDKCKKEVPSTSKAGDHCPHCGTYWGYETEQDGSKKYATGYRAGKIVGGIVFLLALIGTGIKKLAGR